MISLVICRMNFVHFFALNDSNIFNRIIAQRMTPLRGTKMKKMTKKQCEDPPARSFNPLCSRLTKKYFFARKYRRRTALKPD